MTFVCIMRLSLINSPLRVLFAWMPPTFAAARKTYSGRSAVKNLSTAEVSRKSSSFEVLVITFVYSSFLRSLTMELPTMPLEPAT
ncbi:hypothetical protein ATCV1_z285R [Acanthocystis turfacea chlorella virus 1]|uniref:Uncharacterized protein z285R n=1 Tax=Chlorovirus heliozoae TaxID=322019 RepID=A7K8P5_9PHYC|nr:hypothetical protein ATCV1_z285R [Acanthocystis turfacea chlorella virus 1]ABT16419.1 hypothetical protein ATCV1_z285R [Acanthocystis turfacea chlorella virus 1]